MTPPPTRSTLFPYTTLFRSDIYTLLIEKGALRGRRWNEDAKNIRSFKRPKHQYHSMAIRSEEHTSELQSHSDLVCRLLLEKKNINIKITTPLASGRNV